ncbi:hypothetical protein FNH22_14225 [Fulvivirga sp. M361]|uniref:hypothetical protein n=1 Tax=Fulvivirga sp. M361 TaxID=2594266 RepID=UPI00117A0FAD|nr:hypothetical protein [Fulvivirga sp. M361]TRX58216.1 hypothetical protein FNH22_14225 [Fulvivirga sp. M361]
MKVIIEAARISFFFLCIINLTCCSSDDGPSVGTTSVDIKDALLSDFPLTEADYLDIDIVQPKFNDNAEEIEHGSIKITISYADRLGSLSLRSVNFDLSKFNIIPGIGSKVLSVGSPFTYEINSTRDGDKIIHYDVEVVIEEDPTGGKLELTSFKFEKSRNPTLSSDIQALKFTEYPTLGNSRAVFILVPVGTDFSTLIPTITYEGATLEYSKDNGPFIDYPTEGKAIDFKYPNRINIRVTNFYGNESQTFQVIVDVPQPIQLEEIKFVTPDITIGDSYQGFGIMKWINQGNHPIPPLSPNSYINIKTPTGGSEYKLFSASLTKGGSGDINPGQEGKINVLSVQAPAITGEHRSTAVFDFNFDFTRHMVTGFSTSLNFVEDIYEPLEFEISGTVVE